MKCALFLLALVGIAAACRNGSPVRAADLLIVNAKVWTGWPSLPDAEALAIIGGRVAAVGTSADMQAWRGPSTRVVDAGGRRVVPGFNDSHVHFIGGGGSSGLNSRTKGLVEPGKHADLIILKEPFELDGVILKGKWARKDGQTLIRDPF